MKETIVRKHRMLFFLRLCFLFAVLGVCPSFPSMAKTAFNIPLDSENPVYFYGDTIEYQKNVISLDEKNIYIDGTLGDEVCSKYKYVYNDFKEAYASGAITSGTAEQPMNVYLAPYVYWMDDPDDPAIREGVNGDKIPYGLWMNCSYLSLNGLTDQPENVVLAVNRGQNAGAKGNFTMFYINGNGTHTENLTMGNYCCVDLEYPLKPELGRKKRQDAITQSQLVLTNGSKITAKNCHFISRLNSCPFVGGSRIFFDGCHFECTDDSLPTSAVYLNCNFEFYSSKPFYNTTGTGSVMLNCSFHLMHGAKQYLTKAGGTLAIIDGTFYLNKKDQYIGWTPDPSTSLRCYQGNIRTVYKTTDENGKAVKETVENYRIDQDAPYDTVDITGTPAMDAYKLPSRDSSSEKDSLAVYNVYNLMQGSDSYDPLNQRELIEQVSKADGKDYAKLPTMLSVSPAVCTVSDGNTSRLSVAVRGFSTTEYDTPSVTWSLEEKLKDYLTLKDNGDGSCSITCKNEGLLAVSGMVYAADASGLSSGTYVTAAPKTQPAPKFTTAPSLSAPENGQMTLNYELPNADILTDYSKILWYRCSDVEGKECVLVKDSKKNTPLKSYPLSYGDVGYYLKAVISPMQLCTKEGDAVTVISEKPVALSDVTADPLHYYTDFSDFACSRQPAVLPGFFTRDVYQAWQELPENRQTDLYGWCCSDGEVGYGDEGLYGLLPLQRGARLMYTPTAGTYGGMEMTLIVNPEKNAGQGFGSAGQYMDICIKFDPSTLTGYALRLERISNLDCGILASLISYDKGDVIYLGDGVKTSAFNSECTITLLADNGKLAASMSSTHEQSEKQLAAGLSHTVSLEAAITDTGLGGMGIYFTGTTPSGNRVMFNALDVVWKKEGTSISQPVPVSLKDAAEPVDEEEDAQEVSVKKLKKGTRFQKQGITYQVVNNKTNGKGCVKITQAKKSLKTIRIRNTVSYCGVRYQVTAISKNAFWKCKHGTIQLPGKQAKRYKAMLKKCRISSSITIKG